VRFLGSGALRPFLLAATLLLATDAAGMEPRTLKIAVEGANPPFNYIDQNGELQGFEVDLGKALCAAIKAECTFVQHQWDGIIRGLIDRDYDAIMSSLAITESRLKRIAFSRRYYRVRAAFLAPKDTPLPDVGPEALAGKVLATTERSQHAVYAKAVYGDSELRLYGKTHDAILELLVGRADAVLADKRALMEFLRSGEGACCRLIGDVPTTAPQYGKGIGIGLRKEDTELKAVLDAAIEQAMRDGTYDQIRAKYFQFDTK
jgi:polar amino acid transport system substrate-binding protein